MSGAPDGRLHRGIVTLLAVATGVAIASVYYAQPLVPFIGRDLHLRPAVASLVVTLSQVGFALGLLLVVPLGDLVERRRLVTVLAVAAAGALLWVGLSPSAAVLLPGALAVGATAVTAQVLVPFSASLAGEEERGRVVGLVMSGLLLGILLARTVAALLAQVGSWRLVYVVAAGALLVQAAVLRWRLPAWRERSALPYGPLVRSIGSLVRRERLLRHRAAYGFLLSATFNALWTAIAFLLDHRYHFSLVVIGLFGLAGAGGAAAATAAGRLSDLGRARTTTGAAAALLVASWAALWAGSSVLVLLVVGIVVLDVGAQALHITNQGEIYGRLDPGARSRVTSAYMIAYFAGAATGSELAASAYGALGWDGVCLVGGVCSVGALGLWALTDLRAGRPRPVTQPASPPP